MCRSLAVDRLELQGSRLLNANSRNTWNLFASKGHVPTENIRLLHPGVDTKQFVPARRNPVVRARLGWGERQVILTVGRLQKRKGHDVLIRALHEIRSTFPDVLYAIAGAGEEEETLRAIVNQEGLAGNVQFLGEPNDADL